VTETAAPRLAVVTGLLAEARCFAAGGAHPDSAPLIFCSGASAARAREGTREMIARGAAAVLSFGVAAGLDPGLRPGVVVAASEVVAPDGQRLPTDRPWRERVAAAAQVAVPVIVAPVCGRDEPVATRHEKAALRAWSRAAAADMESHAAAEVAAAHALPFLAVRAVADPAWRSVPQAALLGVGPSGETRALAVLLAASRHPRQAAALVRLGIDMAAALRALRRVAQIGALGSGFGGAGFGGGRG
jgi:hopanoid-associated phosphorylase